MSELPAVPGYAVEGKLAAGGQGVVLRARHLASGQPVALKVLRDADPQSVRRFRQEARVLNALRHPHLLRVYEHGEHDGHPFLALELIDGEDVGALAARGGTPPRDWIGRVLATTALTLQFCHEHGVVHRDLKPSNLLVERATQRPVLVDFGLVKRDPTQLALASLDEGSLLSVAGGLRGTPEYMAPEQVGERHGEVSARTDVYGLGATLYHLLTGQPPFQHRAAVVVLRQVARKAPRDPRELNPLAPAELSELCLRCLAKSPDDRPQSAAELAVLLAQATGIPSLPDPRPANTRVDTTLGASLTEVDPRSPLHAVKLGDGLPKVGATFAGHTVVRAIARGGGGAVYEAERDGRRVALKILFADLHEPTAAERFVREFQAGRQLNHQGIVRVFDHGVEGASPWLCMELLEGAVPLDRFVRERALPLPERLRLVEQLADAVQAAHQAGLVHRDLKPDNVLVLPSGQIKVVDFGLARHLDKERLTLSGRIMGTVHYMAPEQVRGQAAHAGPRTDVYALGAMLYELIQGERPFQGGSHLELMAAIIADELPDPCAGVPDAPPGLGDVVRMAMAKEPDDRYASAAAFGRDVVAAASNASWVQAQAVARGARLKRWGLRSLVALALAALLLGAAATWAQRTRWLSPEELENRSTELAREAADLLAVDGAPLAAAEGDVALLTQRLADLEAGLAPEAPVPEKVQRARARVRATSALLALSKGDPQPARRTITGFEGRSDPALDALRGAIAAEDGDPQEATQLLSRAIARGLLRPDLRRWRARSLGRAGLKHTAAAETLIQDLTALQALPAGLDDAERALEVRALLTLGELARARTNLAKLNSAPTDLRWAVSLASVRAHMDASKGDAAPLVEAIAELEPLGPPPRGLEADDLTENATRILSRLSRASSLAPADEDRAAALIDLLRRLGAPPLAAEQVDALLELTVGLVRRKVTLGGLKAAAGVAAWFPDDLAVQTRVAQSIQAVVSAPGKRFVLPALRRAIDLEPDPQARDRLRVLLSETLAQLAKRGPNSETRARECLELSAQLLEEGRPAKAQALVHLHRSAAYYRLGETARALEAAELAVDLHANPTARLRRARLLVELDRRLQVAFDDAFHHVRTGVADANDDMEVATTLVWHLRRLDADDRVLTALKRRVSLRPEHAGFRIRLAWWRLRAGDLAGALEQLEPAAERAALKKPPFWSEGDHAQRAAELVGAVERKGLDATADVEAFVEVLDTARTSEGAWRTLP